MSMLRLARATGHDGLAHLVVSVRTPDDQYYAAEILGRDDATVLYSRATPPGWERPAGRLRADDVVAHLRDDDTVYVCGSAPFTDAVGDLLLDLDVAPERVRFERFGPSA
jgi:ferredoxin-NADP reductase